MWSWLYSGEYETIASRFRSEKWMSHTQALTKAAAIANKWNKHLKLRLMVKYCIQILFILLLCESATASSADTTAPVIKAIEIQDSTPFFGKSIIRIFYIGPFVVYQSQYEFDSSIHGVKFDSTGNETSTVTEYECSETRNLFFVFHRDSSYGVSYDPHRSNENNRRLPVDSTLQRIKGTNSFEGLLSKKPDTTIWNAQNTELREVYVQKASRDTPAVHLIIYYSSKLNNLKATLNPVMDSARKMKFYKYEYLIKEFYSEKEKQLFPEMKFSTEMKEITVTNPEEIMEYIDRYKNRMLDKKQAGSTKGSKE
jgi:hypothetical protein